MSIDINEVSFKITENRWLEIWVGEQEVVSVDTIDGGVSLCRDDHEAGNIIETYDGTLVFKNDDDDDDDSDNGDMPVDILILQALERIEQKL